MLMCSHDESFSPLHTAGPGKAATPCPERYTGHVPEVHEAPAHRGAV